MAHSLGSSRPGWTTLLFWASRRDDIMTRVCGRGKSAVQRRKTAYLMSLEEERGPNKTAVP